MYKRIKDLREDFDYKQSEIAKILNMSQQQYSKIEKGITDITGERLILLSKLFRTSTDYLLGLEDEKREEHLIKASFNEVKLTNKKTKAKKILGTNVHELAHEYMIEANFIREILEDNLNSQFYGILECLIKTELIYDYIEEIKNNYPQENNLN